MELDRSDLEVGHWGDLVLVDLDQLLLSSEMSSLLHN